MSVSTHIYSYPDVPLRLDIYFAPPSQVARNPVPCVVYFHGGLLIAGNRDFFCKDIKRDALSRGWAFITADYRLLIPSTGHEILRDVKSLFAFIGDREGGLNQELRSLGCPHQIDANRLYVGGSSAGAYPAFLSALFAQPKPRGFFSLYGIGGDMLSDHYLPLLKQDGNTEDIDDENRIWTIEEILEEAPELRRFLAPTEQDVKMMKTVSNVPFSYAPRIILNGFSRTRRQASNPAPTTVTMDLIPGTNIPGHKSRISGTLHHALLQTGTYLDFLVGRQGFGAELSTQKDYDLRCEMASTYQRIKYLFPQIWIDKDFPPSIVVHGDADTIVDISQSKRFVERLRKCGVRHVFLKAEGKGHQFEDRASPEVYVKYIKPIVTFLAMIP